ncbi:hypothetical protein Tco_0301912, partial [Tanacetum coccineum]
MGELEQHIADLVEENEALEKRLDKQGDRIHKLETIDSREIVRKIKESVKEVVISSVKHAMRAPLHARFKDLPTAQSIVAQEETKKKGKQDSPKPPPGSPPSPPPPPPPPPSSSTHQGDQSTGTAAPSSSKT